MGAALARAVEPPAPRRPPGQPARPSAAAPWPAWIQRCGIGSTCGCGPEEKQAGLERDLQRVHVQRHPVNIGPLIDPYEQQAHDVAASLGDGARQPIRRQPAASTQAVDDPALHGIVSSPPPGRPVPARVRSAVEPRLGADLSAVRVHDDAASHSAARSIGAKAFTHANHIFLGPGQSEHDVPLMAHELTHTVQQGGGQGAEPVQRLPDLDDIGEFFSDAGEAVYHGAKAAYTGAKAAAGEAWDAVTGVVNVTDEGLVITPPDFCLGEVIVPITLPPLSDDLMIPVVAVPVGTFALTGNIGFKTTLVPKLELQLGPFCAKDLRVVVDPLGTSSTSGTVTAAAAGSLSAELRAGLRGEVAIEGVVMVGPIPVPVKIPLAGIEGGAAGMLRGLVGGKFTAGGTLAGGWRGMRLDQYEQIDLGIGADAFVGAYGQLDVLGKNLCRLYWMPWSWHGEIGTSLGLDIGLDVGFHRPRFTYEVHPPERLDLPFEEIGLKLGRAGFVQDCTPLDMLCDLMREFNLFPYDRGGRWTWTGAYGPGRRLDGPLEVYESHPVGRVSKAGCRGACGTGCETCTTPAIHEVTDPATGQVWEYTGFVSGMTAEGCQQHDAAFDWATEQGEPSDSPFAVIMPWHMAANVECLCHHPAGDCISWIVGGPPHDGPIHFADSSRPLPRRPIDDVGGLSEEELLDRCAKGLLSPEVCRPLEDDMIGRFGNRRRNLELDPDRDPKSLRRPDDAPLIDAFRMLYNRLDSWGIVIRTQHPGMLPEFTRRFGLESKREVWLKRLKDSGTAYKTEFRDLRSGDPGKAAERYRAEVLGTIAREIDGLNREIAVWFGDQTGSTETVDEIIERIHTTGTELWRAAWRAAILRVNRILAVLWPPARARLLIWVGQQRQALPGVDLGGTVGQLDYIGSLATGFKGPPKQHIRFNPQKFDVDANLDAPPLSKWAMHHDPGLVPDRGRLFGRATQITLLHEFTDATDREFRAKVTGYDESEPFDVALVNVPELPVQTRERIVTARMFELRDSLDGGTYRRLLDEVEDGGYLKPSGTVRADLSEEEFAALTSILDRYGRPAAPSVQSAGSPIEGPARGGTLLMPHRRHFLDRLTGKERIEKENTVVLPGTDVAGDLRDILAGKGVWDGKAHEYEVNERRYKVKKDDRAHPRSYPVGGPGLVPMSLPQYMILLAMVRAEGDLDAARKAIGKHPGGTPENWQAALDVFKYHRSYRGPR